MTSNYRHENRNVMGPLLRCWLCTALLFFLTIEFEFTSAFVASIRQRDYVLCKSGTAVHGSADITTKGEKKVTSSKSPKKNGLDMDKLSKLDSCKSGSVARRILDESFDDKHGDGIGPYRLYKSLKIPNGASDRPVSDADLAIQTNIRNAKYSVMDLIELNGDRDSDRASLAILCLTVASSISAIAANQSLPGPEIIRFTVVWIFSFAPLAFVGYGLSTPADLQALLVSIQRNVFPTYRKRMLQHEAGHFLMGHLLGMPIQGYTANAVKNAVEFYPLSDRDVGKQRSSLLGFDKSDSNDYEEEAPVPTGGQGYFSEEGSGSGILQEQSVFRRSVSAKEDKYADFLKLPAQDEPKNSWPYRGFDHATLDKLAAVSVAGVCAEILAFGNAEGGYADLSLLKQILASAEPRLSEKEMENKIRYALGFSMGQIRRHLGALDDLALAMEKDDVVSECVLAIESCKNPSGASLVGDYERLRKQKFQNEGVGPIERIFLGSSKNADAEDRGVIEGKGGGDRKPKFLLTGDDPLYFAVGTAAIFFLWASSGGLSLH